MSKSVREILEVEKGCLEVLYYILQIYLTIVQKFEPFNDLYISMHNRLTCETRVPFAFLSSNLTELHTNVDTFTDCLFLLDGRFKQLHTLFINVQLFLLPSPMSFNQVNYFN